MKQVRIHGRGGQGVVTAAELIAIAAFKDGSNAQAFPSFGVERTGAPVEAFARIDDKFIRTREQVYQPDFLIVQDASLIGKVNLLNGCHEATKIIVNTDQKAENLGLDFPAKNIFTIDATKIALEVLGKNIVNTVILGAFAKDSGLFSLESLEKAIKEKFAEKGQDIINKNIRAVAMAFELNK
jgi:pyruvate ferredoxin oxidoreductase gamma subunit